MTDTIRVDRYVLETLMSDLVGHDRRPAAFLVYLDLWRRTGDARDDAVAVSLRDLAETTGLSKRAVQLAIATLVRRRLVSVTRTSVTAVPVYALRRHWRARG
ncbi:MAG: helix-turn-helix domain-containing protein [Gemmatimonadaceae bacterium]